MAVMWYCPSDMRNIVGIFNSETNLALCKKLTYWKH